MENDVFHEHCDVLCGCDNDTFYSVMSFTHWLYSSLSRSENRGFLHTSHNTAVLLRILAMFICMNFFLQINSTFALHVFFYK